jgi:hypothetical protein
MNYDYYKIGICLITIGVLSFPWLRQRIRPLRRGLLRRKPAVVLPKAYVRPRERRLRQLTFGETGAIRVIDVAVDMHGKAWVDYDAQLFDNDKNAYITVDVRLEKGGCVLILPPEQKLEFLEHRLYSSIITYLPVIEITFAPRAQNQ